MLWTRNLVVLPTYIRSFDFHQKIFTIVMTPGGGTPLYSGTGTCRQKGSLFGPYDPDFWVNFWKKMTIDGFLGLFSTICKGVDIFHAGWGVEDMFGGVGYYLSQLIKGFNLSSPYQLTD